MASFSIWHWLIVILVLVAMLPVIPIARMLRRIGLTPWLAPVFVVPLVGYLALWVVAYAHWPKIDTPIERF